MTTSEAITTDKRTFLISFKRRLGEGRGFIVNSPEHLKELLESSLSLYNYIDIDFIKEFDNRDFKFKRCTKQTFLNWSSWDDGSIWRQLKSAPFFKQ